MILTHMSEHAIRIVDVPSLALRENLAAHVGGCIAAALDPRGRYLASGGYDSIVNLFDTSEWIAARTITVCECVGHFSWDWIESTCLFSLLLQAGHLRPEFLPRWRIPRDRGRRELHRYCALLYFYFLFLGLIPSRHHSVGAVCDGNRCAAASGTSVSQLAKGNVASFKLCYRVLRTNKTA